MPASESSSCKLRMEEQEEQLSEDVPLWLLLWGVFFLWQWRWAKRGSVTAQELGHRKVFLDNIKFVAMVFVVFQHMLQHFMGYVTYPWPLWFFAYIGPSINMTLFALVSGAGEAASPLSASSLARLLFVWLVIYILNAYRSWTIPDWYYYSLILWRIAARATSVLPEAFQAAVVLGAGVAGAMLPASTDEDYYQPAWRALRLWPYFHLGGRIHLGALPRLHPLLRALGCVALYYHPQYTPSEPKGGVLDTFTGHVTEDCPMEFNLVPFRYLVSVAFRSAVLLLFVLSCVPRGRVFFSGNGASTLYPYLLHVDLAVFPGRTLLKPVAEWLSEGDTTHRALAWPHRDMAWPYPPNRTMCWIVFGYAILWTFLLSCRPCRAVLSWVLEPERILRLVRGRLHAE